MELQLKHRVELLLSEERLCLERHKKELAVRKSWVLYLENHFLSKKEWLYRRLLQW